MSNIPTTEGLDIEGLAYAIAQVQHRAEESGSEYNKVELQIRDGYGESGDVYLEVADVLYSEHNGRLVLLAGKRVQR